MPRGRRHAYDPTHDDENQPNLALGDTNQLRRSIYIRAIQYCGPEAEYGSFHIMGPSSSTLPLVSTFDGQMECLCPTGVVRIGRPMQRCLNIFAKHGNSKDWFLYNVCDDFYFHI